MLPFSTSPTPATSREIHVATFDLLDRFDIESVNMLVLSHDRSAIEVEIVRGMELYPGCLEFRYG